MSRDDKCRLKPETFTILKKLGIKNFSEEDYDAIFDRIKDEIAKRVQENEDATLAKVVEELNAFEKVLDHLNDPENKGFDREWINEQLRR